jgi:hypothetical protein
VTFPAGLASITVTGQNLLGAGGSPLSGEIIFTPSGVIADPAVSALLEGSAVAEVSSGAIVQPFALAATDCVSPGFTYTITFRLRTPDGTPAVLAPYPDVAIPHTLGAAVDISVLVPGAPPPSPTAFGTANTWVATQTFDGSPPLKVPPGAVAGYVLTADASGDATWQAVPAAGGGVVPPAGDIGGTGIAPTVTGTHLAAPLPPAQGGTGQAGLQAALDALAGAVTAGLVLRGNGSHVALAALQAGDLPALPYDASGAATAAQSAAQAYAAAQVAAEAGRAEAAEALALAKSANLADLASAPAARSSLGLGSAALQAAAAFDAAGAAAAAQAAAEAACLLLTGGTLAGRLSLTPVTLTDAATIAIDASLGNDFHVTLGGSRVLGAPSNPQDRQIIRVDVIQPGSGGPWLLTYNAIYDFGSGSAPVLSTAAGKVDTLAFRYIAPIAKWTYLGSGLGF